MKKDRYQELKDLLEDAKREVLEAENQINLQLTELEQVTMRTRTEINTHIENIKFWNKRIKDTEEQMLLLGANY